MPRAQREHLTTRQFAESLGVSESSVKRWIDDGAITAERTAGGHRRIRLAAAIRFIRKQSIAPAKPELLALPVLPALGRLDADAAEAFHDALLNDDAAAARAILTGRYISGASVALIGDELIRPALERIGELWKCDDAGILIEHRAVETCTQILTSLYEWLPAPSAGPAAITAGGPGDPYLLPPMLAHCTLLEQGYAAVNLGPSTPLSVIEVAASRYSAALCALSLSSTPAPITDSEWIELADKLEKSGTALIIGGRCARSLSPDVRRRLRFCMSMSELSAFAAGLARGAARRPQARGSKRPA